LAALRPLLEARGAKAEREPPPTRALDVAAPAAAGFVARSRAARRLVDAIARAAESDQAVLILGEPGAGKERAARAIHAASRRRGGPFLVLDCATVPEALLEVELFGARAGAFTDCVEDRAGILAGAEGGTVLIDEVAAAPAAVQAKLLRVLSSGRCRRVGDECETALDVRFLASCRGGLEEEVEAGRFREDLYFRLRGSAVEVPPLRDRPEDLEPLLDTFLREGGGSPPSLARGALERLRELPWPGNVRELKNLAARMRLDGVRVITAEILERLLAQPKTETLFPRSLLARSDWPALRDRLERDYIVHHLRRLRGDTRALAEFLGIRRQQLYRKCGRLGVRVAELRSKEGSAGG
jgi:DNA-binding NtrC family response regulator